MKSGGLGCTKTGKGVWVTTLGKFERGLKIGKLVEFWGAGEFGVKMRKVGDFRV